MIFNVDINCRINIIYKFKPLIDYNYELDDENNYQSWVQSKNLK